MQALFDIQGKVVVLTGGNGTWGQTMVQFLADCGAKIAILSRQSKGTNPVVEGIFQAGSDAIDLLGSCTYRAGGKRGDESRTRRNCSSLQR